MTSGGGKGRARGEVGGGCPVARSENVARTSETPRLDHSSAGRPCPRDKTEPCPLLTSRAPGRGFNGTDGIRARSLARAGHHAAQDRPSDPPTTTHPRGGHRVRLDIKHRSRHRRHRQPRARLGAPGRTEGHPPDVQLRREHQPVHAEQTRDRPHRLRRRQSAQPQTRLPTQGRVRITRRSRRRRGFDRVRGWHARGAGCRAPRVQDGARHGAAVGDRVRDEGDRRRRRGPAGILDDDTPGRRRRRK